MTVFVKNVIGYSDAGVTDIVFTFNGTTFTGQTSYTNNLTEYTQYNITQEIVDNYTNLNGEFVMPVVLDIVGNNGEAISITVN